MYQYFVYTYVAVVACGTVLTSTKVPTVMYSKYSSCLRTSTSCLLVHTYKAIGTRRLRTYVLVLVL